jgi:hypothetical protein
MMCCHRAQPLPTDYLSPTKRYAHRATNLHIKEHKRPQDAVLVPPLGLCLAHTVSILQAALQAKSRAEQELMTTERASPVETAAA